MKTSKNSSSILEKGVEYYNIDNTNITNDNTLVTDNPFFTSSVGFGADTPSAHDEGDLSRLPLERGQKEEEHESGFEDSPAPPLDEDQVARAVIQLFDNGETAVQRYKLKVRINLADKSDNPEFIAPLTKDFRNFKRYIPEESKEEVLEFATKVRKHIKQMYGTYPYLGKFHYNNGPGHTIQVEPYTAAAVWYNNDESGWSGILMIQDWIHEFDLYKDYITPAQKDSGVKCHKLFVNPKYDTKKRPLTWAEKKRGKK